MRLIGEYYKEKILSQKKLKKVELPSNSGEVKVEKDLFGWKLYAGKEFIECDSEEEARLLKIFLEYDMREVRIPKDPAYLKTLVPELEKIKNKTDKIINGALRPILNRKIREKARYEILMEITKYE